MGDLCQRVLLDRPAQHPARSTNPSRKGLLHGPRKWNLAKDSTSSVGQTQPSSPPSRIRDVQQRPVSVLLCNVGGRVTGEKGINACYRMTQHGTMTKLAAPLLGSMTNDAHSLVASFTKLRHLQHICNAVPRVFPSSPFQHLRSVRLTCFPI